MRRVGSWVLVAALAACGSNEGSWSPTTTPTEGRTQTQSGAQGAVSELRAQAEAAWAQRDEEAQVRTAIEKWADAASVDPGQHEVWTSLSRARYFLADCHLRFDDARQAEFMEAFMQGKRDGERALAELSPEFAQRMEAGTRIEEAVTVLDRNAVPALYWRSSNLGKWASAEGIATLLYYKDEIRAIMGRCLELDPDYYYAGPHRYFGVFYARAPSFAGQDLDRSREHFETSIRFEPNYFATHVLLAEDWAVKAQDRAVYEEQLRWVLDHDPNALPDVGPENRCEQRKARIALERIDELFE
jgi:hypothetical protein